MHNLKNINVTIPRGQLTVITGLSGSGKSSLAFDTIFAEGQRRYMDTFSSYARGFIGQMQRPDVDKISGLSPVISIDQRTTGRNPRSTVGTVTEVYDFLRLLYARAGEAYSYLSGKKMVQLTDEQIVSIIQEEYKGQKILLLAPLVNRRKGHYKELFDSVRKKGFVYVRVDGEVQELYQGMKVDRYSPHTIEVVVDRLAVKEMYEGQMYDVRRMAEGGTKEEGQPEDVRRLRQSVDKALSMGNGVCGVVKVMYEGQMYDVRRMAEGGTKEEGQEEVRYFSRNLMDPENGLSYREPAPHTFSFNSPSGWCPCCKGLGRVKGERLKDEGLEDELDEAIRQENWWEELQRVAGSGERLAEEDEEKEERHS